MSHQALLRELMLDIQSDRNDYTALQALLEQQFSAVLAQNAETLAVVAEGMHPLLDRLQQRKQRRQQLVQLLMPEVALRSLSDFFASLPEPVGSRCVLPWQALCEQAAHCKQLNERNGMLLQSQHELYQRVLFGETDTYAAP